VDDAYATPAGTALTVTAALGVLVNDLAPDGGTVVLGVLNDGEVVGGTETPNGFVTINADGSFSYTPAAGYVGPDSFSYRMRDADGSFDDALVRLTVSAPTTALAAIDLDQVALGAGGFRLRGEAAFDLAGRTVAAVGDLNGDGLADFLVGAPANSSDGTTGNGAVYAIYGAGFSGNLLLGSVADAGRGFKIIGEGPSNAAGTALNGAGDVNGDGVPDTIVGAPANDTVDDNIFNGAGAAYVVFGGGLSGTLGLDDVALGVGGFKIIGESAFGAAGRAVAGVGDVNGDGLDDVLVGAPSQESSFAGAAYVVFGKAATSTVQLSAVAAGQGGFKILGEGFEAQAGSAVSALGDINGDGLADLLIASGGTSAPEHAYVVFGKPGTAQVDLTDVAAGQGGFKLINPGQAPIAVAGVGDVNGDGRPDIAIGDASATGPLGTQGSGAVTVVFGGPGLGTIDLGNGVGGNGFRISGTGLGDGAGFSVAAAGDLNGDALADLLVGAPSRGSNGSFRNGSTYVVFGKADTEEVDLDVVGSGLGGFRINGERNADNAGVSVAAPGDVNGDGLDDLLVGSTANVDFFTQIGAAYVIYGQSAWQL
jgi:hypothetical protein